MKTFLYLAIVVILSVPCRAQVSKQAKSAKSSDSTKGWRPLFNGKDLTGWKHVGDGNMTVEDGIIRTHGGMGLLYWAGEKFGNCKIRIVFRMEKENSNAGFFIRIPIEPKEAWMPGPQWNTFEITLDGDHTVVVLNGVKVTDYKEGDPVPPRKFDFEPYPGTRPQFGFIGMQNHGEHDIVFFKEVSVNPLDKK